MNDILRDVELDEHGRLRVQGKAVITEAPRDGKYYARRNAAWADIAKLIEENVSGGGGGNGEPGPPGPQGPPGTPGGPAGPQGEKGDPGDTGPEGPQGETGPQGPAGPAGADSSVPGPQGPKGDTGNTGATGPKGDTGAQGPQGIQGLPGTPGATGATGPQGPAGEDGQNVAIGEWTFVNTITEPPSSGQIRMNNANQHLPTKIWVAETTALNKDVAQYLKLLIRLDSRLYLQDKTDSSKWNLYNVTGAMVDKGTYVEVPVAWDSGGTALADGQRALFSPLSAVNTVTDAPSDGKIYGRLNGAWVALNTTTIMQFES